MSKKPGLSFLAVFLAFLTGAGLLAWSQQELPPELQIKPRHEVTVTVKMIQVYVTDKKSQPVSNLEPYDFEVYDNGLQVPIIHFEKHFPEVEVKEAIQSLPPASLNRKFFLFFDFAFTDARGILRAKKAGLKFLESSLLPTDEVGLLTYSIYSGLTVHEYLTRDRERVRRLINGLGLKNVTGRAETLSKYYYSDVLAQMQNEEGGEASGEKFLEDQARLQTIQVLEKGQRKNYIHQVQFFLTALTNMARALRNVPGYKHLVLFSTGIARQVLFGRVGGTVVGGWATPEQFASQLNEYDAARADTELAGNFSKLIEELKASNCALYTIDISRVHKGADVGDIQSESPISRELDGSDSLRLLAAQTGGRYYASTADPEEAVEEISGLTRSYYVLGFRVDERWDGKYHKIKVKLRKKGYEVYSQGGYFNPKPFKDYSGFEKMLHLIELALAEEPQPFVPIEIPVASLNLMEAGKTSILAFTRAEGESLAEVFGPKTEAYLLLFNEGNEIEFIKKFRVVVAERDRKEKKVFLPSFLVPGKEGKYTCVLIMRNLETGKSARGRAKIKVGGGKEEVKGPEGYLRLEPPLLLVPDTKAQEITGSDEPTLAEIYGYDEKAYSALAGEVPLGTKNLYAAIRIYRGSGNEDKKGVIESSEKENTAVETEGAVEVKAWLVSLPAGEFGQEKKELPVSIVHKKGDGQMVKMLLKLETGELPAGAYRLSFSVSAKGMPEPAETAIRFEVK